MRRDGGGGPGPAARLIFFLNVIPSAGQALSNVIPSAGPAPWRQVLAGQRTWNGRDDGPGEDLSPEEHQFYFLLTLGIFAAGVVLHYAFKWAGLGQLLFPPDLEYRVPDAYGRPS